MRRSLLRILLGTSLCGLLLCGCDSFGPPSRPKKRSASAEAETAKSIYYIVPGAPTSDQLAWGAMAQVESNLHQVIFRIMGPGAEDSPGKQSVVIRKAIEDGASALLVVPGNDPDLALALQEAESKKIPVVLIGGSIPVPPGSKPFTTVEHAPFEESAKRIVATAVEDLKKINRSADGSAIVMADKMQDSTSNKRVEALKAAAEKAGFLHVSVFTVDGLSIEGSKVELIAAIKANPSVCVVFGTDNETMFIAAQARVDLKGNPVIFVGGYTNYTSTPVLVPLIQESCFVEGRFEELARLGVLTLLKKLNGEEVAPVLTQGPKFNRSLGAVTSADAPNSSFPMQQKPKTQTDLLNDIKTPPKDSKPQ